MDYVIATGKSHSVFEFVVEVLSCLDLIPRAQTWPVWSMNMSEIDPKLFRTGEIHDLRGDATLARQNLKWQPEVDFSGLVRMMVESDAGVRAKESHFATRA